MRIKRVVMYSGGIGSCFAAKRVALQYGTEDLYLLFCDTKIEDEDLYRFLKESARWVGGKLVCIEDGRTPGQVYSDERFLGNSRIAPCSKLLKQIPAEKWLDSYCDPKETICYVGIDWTEEHRFIKLKAIRLASGWSYEAPMCQSPYMTKGTMTVEIIQAGIKPPRLYQLGFEHNNCGGFCCRGGQAHFLRLLEHFPDRYAEHEKMEQDIRKSLGKDVSMMKETKHGVVYPLTMLDLRLRVQDVGGVVDLYEGGAACGCFTAE